MRYETPELLQVGPAYSLIHGVKAIFPRDGWPESDLRKGDDLPEGLDE